MASRPASPTNSHSNAACMLPSRPLGGTGESYELHSSAQDIAVTPVVGPPSAAATPTGIAVQGASKGSHEIFDQTSRLPFHRLISAYLCLAAIYFISTLDINSVATALPAISRSLNAGSSITWTATAYLMGQTAFLALYGRLSDIFGRKPVLLICVGFLILGDILCGFARNVTWLYVCRALSGVGGGGISSLVQITVSDLVSLKDRGKYQVGMCLPLKQVTGSWRNKLQKIDWFGLCAAVAAIVFLLIPINSGGSIWPWNSTLVISLLAVGATFIIIFAVIENRFARLPLIPLHLFTQASTATIFLQSGLYNCVWQVDLYFLPIYFQDVRGYSPLQSATLVLPSLLFQSLAGVASGPLMSKLARYGPVLYIGMALWVLGAGLKILFSRTTPVAVYVIVLAIEGTGIGFVLQPALVGLQALLQDPQDRAVVTSTLFLLRMLGSVVGMASSTAILTAVTSAAVPDTLPAALRSQVIDGTWQRGEQDSEEFESIILDAKMKGIRAVFIMLVPLLGLYLLGCRFFPEIVLKGDQDGSRSREGDQVDQSSA